jgi:trehalose 6-phosphate phosphatase
MNPDLSPAIFQHLLAGGHIWLFLDYDGTLVPLARTPEEACSDEVLLALLTSLAEFPQIRVAIVSGRALSSLRKLLPVRGLTLAGTYGMEVQPADGPGILRTEIAQVRPTIEKVLSAWAALVAPHPGFLLEDKGVALALHARLADPRDAHQVLPAAQAAARQILEPDQFRLLAGDRFLEVAPLLASKGLFVDWLLGQTPAFDALPVYLGDDERDEEAFVAIRRQGGIPILVGGRDGSTQALGRLSTPVQVREWLAELRRTLAATCRRQSSSLP